MQLEYVEKLASLIGKIDNLEACSLMIEAIHATSIDMI